MTFFKKHDLKSENSVLKKLTFVLNLIMNCSSNSTHSEYYDIIRKIYFLLHNQILILKISHEFTRAFHDFSFFFDWKRIQFFVIHMNSWSMSECDRVSMIISIMLRDWLRNHHLHSLFKNKLKIAFFDIDVKFQIEKKFTIFAFANLSKNNALISFYDLFCQNREIFHKQIFDVRKCFLNLMNVAHYSNFKKKIKKICSKRHNAFFSKRNSVFEIFNNFYFDHWLKLNAFEIDLIHNSNSMLSNEAIVDETNKLFNFHIDMHFEKIMRKYAVLWNVNVLFDENKHKFFKKTIFFNNHRKSAKQILLKNILIQIFRCFMFKKAFHHINMNISFQFVRFHKNCFFCSQTWSKTKMMNTSKSLMMLMNVMMSVFCFWWNISFISNQ